MKELRLQLDAALAILARDLALFTSYRSRLATTLASSVVGVTLFYYVSRLVSSPRVGSPDDYFAFVVVGLAVFSLLSATLSLSVATLRQELVVGTFERMVLSPFGAVRSIGSLLLFPVALTLATSGISLLYATVVFGLEVSWPEALLGLPVALLSAAAFAPFGLALCAAVVVFKQTNAGAAFVVAGLTFLSGIYFPVALLPGWLRWAAEVQPFTPAVDVLRHVLVGTALREELWVSLTKLVVFPAVTGPLALCLLGRAVRRGRRTGTIIEA
ncbi:MAG: ABC transporter permease [Solirubrobacterales bacterium]|nr:ABC transporter permease [Solirubrobacterales bacterium]